MPTSLLSFSPPDATLGGTGAALLIGGLGCLGFYIGAVHDGNDGPVTLAFLIVGVPCIVIGVIVCSVAAYRYCVKYDLPGRIRGRSAEDEADDNSADGEIQQNGEEFVPSPTYQDISEVTQQLPSYQEVHTGNYTELPPVRNKDATDLAPLNVKDAFELYSFQNNKDPTHRSQLTEKGEKQQLNF